MFSNELVIDILNYIENNLYKKITINEISNIFHYNKDYIMRVFKKELDITIIDYINKKRIYNSLQAFKYSDLSVLSISISYGFSSQEYFCEMFHKIIGVPPTVYYNFINFRNIVNERDFSIIQSNIAYLEYTFRKIDSYHTNIPPERSIKILSIFK